MDVFLKLTDIEDVFREHTLRALGLDPTAKANANRVRISWPTGGAPSWKITEDVAFLRVTSPGGPITKQRDVEYSSADVDNASRTVTYTRVHNIQWILYGPNSFDQADLIRHSLFLPDIREGLAKKNLFLVTDVDDPVRNPELYAGQWWQRADFSARYNEYVKREAVVPYIQSAEIKLYTEKGEVK